MIFTNGSHLLEYYSNTSVVMEDITTKKYDGENFNEDDLDSPTRVYNGADYQIIEVDDVPRELTRIDSLSSYIIVSSLTAASSVQVCVNISNRQEMGIFNVSTLAVATLSALTGVYSSVIFSLCATVSFQISQDVFSYCTLCKCYMSEYWLLTLALFCISNANRSITNTINITVWT